MIKFSSVGAILAAVRLVAATHAIVDLGYARYKGISNQLNGVTSWKGIAYAEPPLGKLRFSSPRPPAPVEGLQQADAFKPACLGVGQDVGLDYDEDCLYLDVFAPTNATIHSKLPVLFYIPGGGYAHNDPAHIDGSGLVAASKHNMIVVTINWRVSLYGFLAGREVALASDASLNNGIRDQIQALSWTRSYITLFGGDPNSVTLGGVSAGAGSIAVLLTAYEGKNDTLNSLYHAVALEEPWLPALFTPSQMDRVYHNITRLVGCGGAGSIDCLRNISSTKLQQVVSNANLTLPGAAAAPLFVWGPTIDGGLVPDVTYALLAAGRLHQVPSITGDDSNGGGYSFFEPSTVNITDQIAVNQAIRAQWPTLTTVQLSLLQELYTLSNVPVIPFEAVGGPYYNVLAKEFGDMMVRCSAAALSDALRRGGSPSWNYIYNIPSPRNSAHGAVHGEELSAIFGSTALSKGENENYTAPEITQIQTYWTSFVRFRDPNANCGATVPYWKPWSPQERCQLWFEAQTAETSMKTESALQQRRCRLHDSFAIHMLQ